MNDFFRRFSRACAAAVGSSWAFLIAIAVTAAWAITGPIFHYSNGWQLVINTGTSVLTFLIVFIIQNTQNRDSKAMQIKLDELLRAVAKARTGLVDIEDLSDAELNALQKEFQRLREQEANDAQPDRHETRGDRSKTPST